MTSYTSYIIIFLALAIPATSSADMLWNDFSLSYLKGNDYEVGDAKREVITLEHASGHTWGDTFLFIDHLRSKSGDKENYLEFSPRLSLSNLTQVDLTFGSIKDVLIAGTWEHGENFDNHLIGIGFSLDIPGFNYANADFYKVFNDNKQNDEQLTLSWAYPFKLSNAEFVAYSQAIVKTGIDLTKIKRDDIKIEGNIIELELPAIEVLDFAYPFERYVIDTILSDNDIFNKVDVIDQEDFFRKAEVDIRKHLKYMGITEQTQENTRKMMERLLKNLGYEEIYIEFADSTNLIQEVLIVND